MDKESQSHSLGFQNFGELDHGEPNPKSDMRFVKNFTPPYFQAKDFTTLISLNFNSFSDTPQKKQGKVN